MDAGEIWRLFAVKIITAPVSEEFDVLGFYGKHGTLFIAAVVYGAVVFPVQVGASEHYAAAISTPVALAPAESKPCAHIALAEVDQIKSAEFAYAFL